MTHLKRQKVPKNWPIARKGTAYVVRPNFGMHHGIPVLIVLRDMLKVAQNRREVKRVLHEKKILLNGTAVKEDGHPVMLHDILTIIPAKKSYRMTLKENGKFHVEEVSEKDMGKKIVKVIGKKVLKGKKVQLNLMDGRNFLTDLKCSTNDSVLINLKEKKAEICLPLREKAEVIIFAGKHAGKKGTIAKLNAEKKMAEVDTEHGKMNVLIKQLVVVG